MKLGAYHFADNTFNLDEVLALPDTLIENELFGTSAAPSPTRQMKRGPLELADGGTAFLDELARSCRCCRRSCCGFWRRRPSSASADRRTSASRCA
jgi:hypothetical protein